MKESSFAAICAADPYAPLAIASLNADSNLSGRNVLRRSAKHSLIMSETAKIEPRSRITPIHPLERINSDARVRPAVVWAFVFSSDGSATDSGSAWFSAGSDDSRSSKAEVSSSSWAKRDVEAAASPKEHGFGDGEVANKIPAKTRVTIGVIVFTCMLNVGARTGALRRRLGVE